MALLATIDRDALCRDLGGGSACRVADSYAPEDGWEPPSRIDGEIARGRLATAFRADDPLPVLCDDSTDSPMKAACDQVVADLTAVGVPVAVEYRPIGDVHNVSASANWAGLIVAISRVAASSPAESPGAKRAWGIPRAIDGYNIDDPGTPGFGAEDRTLFTSVRSSLYPERRLAAQGELARRYREVLPTLPLFLAVDAALVSPTLRGYDPARYANVFEDVENWYTVHPEP